MLPTPDQPNPSEQITFEEFSEVFDELVAKGFFKKVSTDAKGNPECQATSKYHIYSEWKKKGFLNNGLDEFLDQCN